MNILGSQDDKELDDCFGGLSPDEIREFCIEIGYWVTSQYQHTDCDQIVALQVHVK